MTDDTGHDDGVRIEPSPKRIRVYLGGQCLADTTGAHLVWERGAYPTYFLPVQDVTAGTLVATGEQRASSRLGEGERFDVRAGDKVAAGAAGVYREAADGALAGLVRFDWAAMDAWFEEDEEVFIHPRSPYTRIDILPSSRHVRVDVDGVTVAESSQPRLLFETGLPVRYYVPFTDVRMDLLRPSDKRTGCPYKGWASYWTLHVNGKDYPDLVWSYRTPLPESQRIAGLACFYNERIDLYVNDVLQERPETPFSPPRDQKASTARSAAIKASG